MEKTTNGQTEEMSNHEEEGKGRDIDTSDKGIEETRGDKSQ